MADSTLDSELFVLFDNFPGVPTLFADDIDSPTAPPGGFLGPSHHNVAIPAYEIGTKYQIYNDATAGKAGYATMIYLQVATQDAGTAIAVRLICIGDGATMWWQVTNDPDSCVDADGSPVVAVALSAMTNNYYGWFWCGGVCPETWVAALGGNYHTKDAMAAGNICINDMTTDFLGIFTPGADTDCPIGFALAADAA